MPPMCWAGSTGFGALQAPSEHGQVLFPLFVADVNDMSPIGDSLVALRYPTMSLLRRSRFLRRDSALPVARESPVFLLLFVAAVSAGPADAPDAAR